MKQIILGMRIGQEMHERLVYLANKTGRSKSFYMRKAVERCLDDLEDIYLADYALEKIRAGAERSLPLEEAKKRLGLED
jgi:RHH-type rel operon transcriptional repressor/antitoxin RelB